MVANATGLHCWEHVMTRDGDGIIPLERVQNRIFFIRGQKVIIDSDLAQLYGVTTGRLNEQVKRNQNRFPTDFMFQLNKDEFENLISHFATSSSNWGGRRKLPFAFTEHGALMAATVLKTECAAQVSVYVVRAFVQLRRLLESNRELAARLEKNRRPRNFRNTTKISFHWPTL